MFVSRRRIGTPRVSNTSGKKKNEFHKHNEGHTIIFHSTLPPIIREALTMNSDSTPFGIINRSNNGTCGFYINSQIFIWSLQVDKGPNTSNVHILDLPDEDWFVSFTGNTDGIIACSKIGSIQYWPSFRKDKAFSVNLPIQTNILVSSIECNDNNCWIGLSDGKIFHYRLKHNKAATFDFIRQFSKNKSVLGKVFSWGWSNPSLSPILKIHSYKSKDERKNWLLIQTEKEIDIYNSTVDDNQLIYEIPIYDLLVKQLNGSIRILDSQKYQKSIYILIHSFIGNKNGLQLVHVSNVFSQSNLKIRKIDSFDMPRKFNYNLLSNPSYCNLLITTSGAGVIITPNLIIATETPIDKDPLVVQCDPIGLGLIDDNSPIIMTNSDLLDVNITRVIKKLDSRREHIQPDSFTKRFHSYLQNNRIEEFAKADNDKRQLEELVVGFSIGILDDKDSHESESSSLLLHKRLEEKNELHRKFIEFLSLSKVLDYIQDTTKYKLLSHMEKMEGAMTLYELIHSLNNPSPLIRISMNNCIQYRIQRDKTKKNNEGYTLEDIFFSEVTKIEQLLSCIPIEDCIHNDPSNTATYLYESNIIFLSILSRPWKHRNHYCGKLDIDGTSTSSLWNFSSDIRGIVLRHGMYVGKYINTILQTGSKSSVKQLAIQLQEITEFLLDTYQFELQEGSLMTEEQKNRIKECFEIAKHSLILQGPFLAYNNDIAKDLAEKFTDFNTLTQICDKSKYPNNIKQLNPYLIKYQHTNFPGFVFKYFMDSGRYRELLCDEMDIGSNLDILNEDQIGLNEFLNPYPSYSWLHSIRLNEFQSSSNALLYDAFNEIDHVDRRSILLGLSKLTNLASNDNENYKIDHARYLNDFQRFNDSNETEPKDGNIYINEMIYNHDYIGALELYEHTTLLRTEELNQAVCFQIWLACLSSTDWVSLAVQWGENNINDNIVDNEISQSNLYELCKRTSWNYSSLLVAIMNTYLDEAKKQIDEDNVQYLKRLLEIVGRTCTNFQ